MEGGIAALVDAVIIVHVSRPIEADAQQETVGGEERAPVVIQRDGVGLQGVGDSHARALVLLLIAHGLLEEIQPHQRGFAALPREVDVVHLLRRDVLADVLLKQIVRHAELAARIQRFFGEEVAVFAIEVADGASRLGHQMESGGLLRGSSHGE